MPRREFRRGDLVVGLDKYLGIFEADLGNGEAIVFNGNGLRVREPILSLTGMPMTISSPLGADPYANFAELLQPTSNETRDNDKGRRPPSQQVRSDLATEG